MKVCVEPVIVNDNVKDKVNVKVNVNICINNSKIVLLLKINKILDHG